MGEQRDDGAHATRTDEIHDLLGRRRRLEHETDPDELLAKDAADVAMLLASFGEQVVIETPDGKLERRSGPEMARAFHEPLTDEELVQLPAHEPHHDELVAAWIGYRPRRGDRSAGGRALIAEAWDLLRPMGLWCSLVLLEDSTALAVPPTWPKRFEKELMNREHFIAVSDDGAADHSVPTIAPLAPSPEFARWVAFVVCSASLDVVG
jgi:hypothetical protein